MTGTPWILKTFQIDQTGQTGAHIFIEARQPGIFAFILNLIGLDPTAQLKVTKGAVSFRATSLTGMTETSTSLTQIGSFQGGYSKPIGYLVLALVVPIFSIFLDIAIETIAFTIIGLFLTVIFLIVYALQKNLAFGFETSGGAYYGMSFKRGILNNVSIDIDQVENALLLVNALIGSATLGRDYSLSSEVQKVSSQTTIIAAPPVSRNIQPVESQVYTMPVSHESEPKPSSLSEESMTSISQEGDQFIVDDSPNSPRLILYQKVTDLGFQIGSFEDFNSIMDDEGSRWNFYSNASNFNMPIGTWDDFNSKMS